MQRFQTDFVYTNRVTKAEYVWLKYSSLMKGRKILDVGADTCNLRQYLDKSVSYWGIGLGGEPDQQVDLEKEKIPFDDKAFDTALCLDVLEHLDNIHEVFDELCRVACHYVIVSLPNPWADFVQALRSGGYCSNQTMKYYGLPMDSPDDRHKWFFSSKEAEDFISYRAKKNGFHVIQMDKYYGPGGQRLWRKYLARSLGRMLSKRRVHIDNYFWCTVWAVLERSGV